MLKNRFYWLFDENDGSNQGGGGDGGDSSNEENSGSDENAGGDNSDNEEEGEENENAADSEGEGENTETLDITSEQAGLVKLLLDPHTRKATIQALAQREGLNLAESRRGSEDENGDNSGKGRQKSTRSLIEEIQETMGDEFDSLPKKFWKALEIAIDAKISPVHQRLELNAEAQNKREANRATDLLYKNHPDAHKYTREITQLADRYAPDEGQDPYEFLEEMYLLAKAKRQKSANSQEKRFQVRVGKNARDAGSTASGRVNDQNIRPGGTGNKRRSIDEAIALALNNKKK